jgi:hypothetical protein
LYTSGCAYIADASAMAGLRPARFTSEKNQGDELDFQTLLGKAIAASYAAPLR